MTAGFLSIWKVGVRYAISPTKVFSVMRVDLVTDGLIGSGVFLCLILSY